MLRKNRKRYYPVILACIVLLFMMFPNVTVTANDKNDMAKPLTLYVDSEGYAWDTGVDFGPGDAPVEPVLFLANEPLTDSYSVSDIAVINGIIENNGLNRTKWTSGNRPPFGWTGVTWDKSTPKRIISLSFRGANLTGTLNVSRLNALKSLDCDNNQLTSLDVRGLNALKTLYCLNNQLTSLDVSGLNALEHLYCNNNRLTSLDVRGLNALETLYCNNNRLTSLDVRGLNALKTLYCLHNQLTSLDVSRLNALEYLSCSYNQLTSLDVSGLNALGILYCDNNRLASLDVSGLNALEYLHCFNNRLTSLVLDNSASYWQINVSNNFMKDPSVITGQQINWGNLIPYPTFFFSPQKTPIILNVINGTGGGNYADGDLVTIVADAAPRGQAFEKWISPEGVNFADAHSETTTFTMPGYTVTVEAVYTDASGEISKVITLGKDNNSFRHICESFFGKKKCCQNDRYDLSDSLFDRLVSNQTESIKNSVRAAKDKEWGGSCFGISSTIALAKVENININNYDPDAINYFSLPQPSKSQAVRDMINYYHLSQYLPVIKEARVSATRPSWSFNRKEEKQKLKTTLQNIVEKAKKINNGADPFLICFAWKKPDDEKGGHAVIANGYGLVNGEHRIQIYDPNYNQEYLRLTVGSDYLSWQLRKADGEQTYYNIDDRNWIYIDCLDIDAYNAINIDGHRGVMRAAGMDIPFSDIYIDAAGGFTIKNNQGDRLVLGEDGLSGDLIPDAIGFINNYTLDGLGSGEMVLSFPEDNAFTIIPANGDVDVSLATSHDFTSVRADRATDITIAENNGVKVNGDNCDYTIYVSNDSDNHALIRIDGEKGNEIEVKPVTEGILLKADHLDNVHIQTFGETEKATLSFSSQGSQVLLKDNLNSTALEVLESANNDEVFNKVIAQTSDYTDWSEIIEKESNAELTITFNKEVDPAAVNTTNIFVATDEAGINKVAGISLIRAADNAKQIKVYPPSKGWQQGGTYYLFIGKNISSTAAGGNKKLSEPMRACFNIR